MLKNNHEKFSHQKIKTIITQRPYYTLWSYYNIYYILINKQESHDVQINISLHHAYIFTQYGKEYKFTLA